MLVVVYLTGHSIIATIHLSNWQNNEDYIVDGTTNNKSLVANHIKENFLKRFEDFGIKRFYMENYINGFVFLDKNYKVIILK